MFNIENRKKSPQWSRSKSHFYVFMCLEYLKKGSSTLAVIFPCRSLDFLLLIITNTSSGCAVCVSTSHALFYYHFLLLISSLYAFSLHLSDIESEKTMKRNFLGESFHFFSHCVRESELKCRFDAD